MRYLVALLLIAAAQMASAQLVIDGRAAMFDELTNTFLATVPANCFNDSVTLDVSTGTEWTSCTIDGKSTEDTISFNEITADKTFLVSYVNSNGEENTATLKFTFLPLVQLQGTFGYDYEEGILLLSSPDAQQTDTLAATIKWRGGTTNAADKHKRNYKVKLKKNKSLLGLRNDDNWILDAGQADVFRLRNRIAMDLWNDIASPPYYIDREPAARNGVSGKVVEVFLNNEYRGIYNFSENLDRKQMRLKKVQDGEVRGCLYKAKGWHYATMSDTLTIPYDNLSETWDVFEVKYPDLADCDSTDWSTLYNAIDFVVMSSGKDFKEHVAEYFDLPVLIDYWLFLSATNAGDNGGKNMFWAVYDKKNDKKLTLAAWDLDLTFGQRWGGFFGEWEEINVSPYSLLELGFNLSKRLINYNVKDITQQLNDRYQELRKGPLATSNMLALLDQYYNAISLSGAAHRETRRWSGDADLRGEEIDFEKEYQYIRNWINIHMYILDILEFPLYLSIEDTEMAHSNSRATSRQGTYTLNGQKLTDNQPLKPGIYIRNGRKVIIR